LWHSIARLPSPKASDGPNGGPGMRNGRGVADALPGVVALLPTPTPFTNDNREAPDEWLRRRADVIARTGTHHGLPLAVAARSITEGKPILQSDPMRSLEEPCQAPSANTAATMTEPCTSAQPASQVNPPGEHGSCGNPSPSNWAETLPITETSPTASGPTSGGDMALLNTPSAADGAGGHLNRGGDRGGELLLKGQLMQAGRAADYGPYAAAVERWEQATGREAPPPTIQRGERHRLNPAFVEWMMGLPEGWVTGIDGMPATAQLKMLGNGVVPQQALLALQLLDPLD
jgi:DNA (cytosine-5)-methyltransferase 1